MWEHDGQPSFSGEVEPCINGLALELGAYFGQEQKDLVDRLLGEQLSDGRPLLVSRHFASLPLTWRPLARWTPYGHRSGGSGPKGTIVTQLRKRTQPS